jgi:predicted RNase H-like HicB family nuclease/transcriptional regulator with XRE-family HTH domain
MSEVKTYRATVERDDRWWLVKSPDVPGALAQVKRLEHARDAIRDVISLILDVPVEEVEVTIGLELGDVALDVREAMELRQQAEELQARASRRMREAASTLAGLGMTIRDIGTLLGVSHQRVAQLLADVQESPRVPGVQHKAELLGKLGASETATFYEVGKPRRGPTPAGPRGRSASSPLAARSRQRT